MERPDISDALGTKMVVLRAAGQEKVYVHKALLNGEIAAFGKCTWSCFSSTTVKSFVEYLYQGDYNPPPVLYTSIDGDLCPVIKFSCDYGEILLTHAQLFILSRNRNKPSLADLCLERLKEAMVEAQGNAVESFFVRNMRTLIEYAYNPCCYDSDDGIWEELQKAVCRFLVSQKGWLLEVSGSGLVGKEEQLTKDLLAMFIKLSIDKDKLHMEAERKYEALKTEITEIKSAKKNRRERFIGQIS